MVINSGCRCPARNIKVGGVENSSHLLGLAVDVAVVNGNDKYRLVKAALEAEAWGVGVYSSWVHIDLKERSKPTLWLG